MRGESFRNWLAANYTSNSAATHFSQAKKVEEGYGDLDAIVEEGRLELVASELNYSSQDAKSGKPNPSKLQAGTNLYTNLAAYKSSLRCYARFCGNESKFNSEFAIEVAGQVIKEKIQGKQFELERNLQSALRKEIGQLEVGLTIIDSGMERGVESGSIDILARDATGALVVIELKAGIARRETVGQILGYMGDLKIEKTATAIRGILVAADFDYSSRSSAIVVPDLLLRQYRFEFSFSEPV